MEPGTVQRRVKHSRFQTVPLPENRIRWPISESLLSYLGLI
jgi:hypothetical protein